MDDGGIDLMDASRLCVYRTAAKLQRLQQRCHLDVVHVRHVAATLRSVGGALSREEVTRVLDRMFHGVSQEVDAPVTSPEETVNLVFTMFDRGCSGSVAARCLHATLVALCGDTLQDKFTGLLSVMDGGSGCVSRVALRTLLQDLSQIPVAVQEEGVFGGVEAAIGSCFHGVSAPTASHQHVLAWLQSEPRLLLWLPALARLTASHNVTHNVRCHTCRTAPITGLRFRCLKCVNVHVCQSCFLSRRHTRKHKDSHPVLEFCKKPNWRESMSSLLQNTRHALLPRRFTRREADRRVLMWAEPAEVHNSAPPPSEGVADDGHVTHDASVQHSPQETDEASEQASALLSDIRDLQRDKRLMEAELQAWRATVQSEQEVLENRCSSMEVTMETLRQHNVHLQDMLTQTLKECEHRQATPPSDTQRNTEEEEEEELMEMNDWSDEQQTPSPTIHQHWPESHDGHCEDDPADDGCLYNQSNEPEEAGLEDSCPMEEEEEEEEEEEDYGTCVEDLLQETVSSLKAGLETDSWTGVVEKAELVEAAEQVGDSILLLVDSVK